MTELVGRRQAGQLTSAAEILTQVMSLRRLIDKKHEFALPIDDLPRDVQTQIDGNNLVLAILETEARWRLVEKVRDTIAGHVDGVNVLGSAAWGAYSEVKESSDVDLEVMLARADFKEFSEQLEAADFTRLNKAESLSLLRCGRGRVFAFLRALVDAGYLAGADAEEQARAALTKLGIFAELHQETPFDNGWGHKPEEVGHEPVTPWFADYLAWKIDVDGVDVSLHVVPTETYCAAADVDLRSLDSTRVLTEIRVGQRKKVTAGKKETTHADFTSYPDKRSFDGKTVDFRCAVRAVLKEGDKLRLLRPSELSAQGYRDEDVYAWATQTPCVVIENGQLYHGLFQDKTLWGELIDSHSDELAAARSKMLAHLVDRMAAEIEAGLITSSNASILQLTSRFERVPAYAKRALLLEMRSQGQDAFLRLDELFEQLGSDELRRYGLEPAQRNVD